MNRKIKAQRLFEKFRFYNIPKNNSSEEYKEYRKAKDDLACHLIGLALRGKLFVEQKDGITNKLRAVDPAQDCWLGED